MTSAEKGVGIIAFLMHGECKAIREGWRTRDNHLIEWFPRLAGDGVLAVSRPEPWPRVTLARRRAVSPGLPGVSFLSPEPRTLLDPRHRRSWWLRSLRHAAWPALDKPVVIWNPMIALDDRFLAALDRGRPPVVFDLLDDWLVHPAFASLQSEVRRAYQRLAGVATSVTANSEGTLARANELGRQDAILIPNGCDPEKFSTTSQARGPLTVGYAGKIGDRLDTALILAAARAHPGVRFVLAGPVLDRQVGRALRRAENVELVGDVPYPRYPELLATFDIAWVPHLVGQGEVGGDAIKTYEYRAAGLPTLSTPIIGAQRAPVGTAVLPAAELLEELGRWIAGADPTHRVPRQPCQLPEEMTWRHKAGLFLDLLGVPTSAGDRS